MLLTSYGNIINIPLLAPDKHVKLCVDIFTPILTTTLTSSLIDVTSLQTSASPRFFSAWRLHMFSQPLPPTLLFQVPRSGIPNSHLNLYFSLLTLPFKRQWIQNFFFSLHISFPLHELCCGECLLGTSRIGQKKGRNNSK